MIKRLKRKIVVFTVVAIGVVVAAFAAVMAGLAIGQKKQEFNRALEFAVSRFSPDRGGTEIGAGVGKGNEAFAPTAICVIEYNASDGTITTLTSDVSIDEETANSVVKYVLSHKNKSGVVPESDLAYSSEISPFSVRIAIADNSYLATQTLNVLLFTIGGTVAVIAVVFLISLYVSSVAVRPVENSIEEQKRFIADASHELKTPLSVIAANNKILEGTATNDQTEWLASNDYEIRHMTDIIKDMLTLAQGESLGEIEKSPVDVSKIADSVLLQFDAVAYEKSVTLSGVTESGVTVDANDKMICRLFMILVDNAIKYEPQGGEVRVNLAKNGAKAVFTVNNRGSVIADKDLPHIFDRFYRSEKSRTSGGVGLGLAIAKYIVDLHGGTIKAFSSESEGTTFKVEFSLR